MYIYIYTSPTHPNVIFYVITIIIMIIIIIAIMYYIYIYIYICIQLDPCYHTIKSPCLVHGFYEAPGSFSVCEALEVAEVGDCCVGKPMVFSGKMIVYPLVI